MAMGISLKAFLFQSDRKTRASRPVEIRFCGGLSRDASLLIALPIDAGEAVLSLRAMDSLTRYFRGEKAVVGDSSLGELFSYTRLDIEFCPLQDLPSFLKERKFDLFWDLNRPPSPIWKYITGSEFKIRIGSDPDRYPDYNVITEVDPGRPGGEYQEEALRMLLIPINPFVLRVSEDLRRKTWDKLLYKGHDSDRVLVFLDVADPRNYSLVKHYLLGFFKGSVTFLVMRVSRRTSEEIDIGGFEFGERLAALSLSDLYVGEGGFYSGLAAQLKIPQMYIPGSKLSLPAGTHFVYFEPDEEGFSRDFKELLSS
ncbi:MAG: hypothetical protein J7L74_03735 [Candidatus Hydrothermae bacterium]|nr:hypothetical protein [Candidatus Hydrothermae bacterium]RKZ03969.1 MAG: hypothetical protein DRQ04_01610 [Candidatus Hydrothermae bacterium]